MGSFWEMIPSHWPNPELTLDGRYVLLFLLEHSGLPGAMLAWLGLLWTGSSCLRRKLLVPISEMPP